MATDRNDELLTALIGEVRGLRDDVRALAPPARVQMQAGTVELQEPAVLPATAPAKKTTPRRTKR